MDREEPSEVRHLPMDESEVELLTETREAKVHHFPDEERVAVYYRDHDKPTDISQLDVTFTVGLTDQQITNLLAGGMTTMKLRETVYCVHLTGETPEAETVVELHESNV